MKHHPNPSQNAPSSRASNAPIATHPMASNPLGNVIDLPDFLSPSDGSSTSENSAAAASFPAAAAVSFSAPGMALTHEQNSEPFFIPSFLHCARPAHDAIKPEPAGTVIPIASANNVATGESAC